jgi:hypothetical protein
MRLTRMSRSFPYKHINSDSGYLDPFVQMSLEDASEGGLKGITLPGLLTLAQLSDDVRDLEDLFLSPKPSYIKRLAEPMDQRHQLR